MSRNFESLQACRGIAALLVVLYHLGLAIAAPKYFNVAEFGRPAGFGHIGVEFFFVLSGFIITYVHWGDVSRPGALPLYLKRRFARIYPIYWIVFLSVFLSALMLPPLRDSVPHDPALIAKALALMPLDQAVVGDLSAPVITVAWSLQYEVVFYALFALAILNRWLGLLAVAFVSAIYASCLNGCTFPQSFIGVPYLLLFGAGSLVAVVERKGWRVRRPGTVAITAAIIFVLLGIAELFYPAFKRSFIQEILLGLSSALTIAGLLSWETSRATPPTFGPLRFLGDASYALYLVHYPLISILCKIALVALPMTVLGASVAYVLILLACLSLAAVVHLRVERPLLRALR